MLNRSYFYFTILLFLAFQSCSSSKKSATPEIKPTLPMPRLLSSQINIPVVVNRATLNRTVTDIIKQNIAEGLLLEDGYKCLIKLSNNLDIQASGNKITTISPLDIEVYPSSEIGSIKAFGTLELSMQTSFDILNNQLYTKTEVLNYRWLKSPVLKIFGISIPVEKISDQFIRKYKSQICSSIDETISKNVILNSYSSKIKEFFRAPMSSTEDSIISVFTDIQEIEMGPMEMENDNLHFPLYLSAETVISDKYPIEDFTNNIRYSIRPKGEDKSSIVLQSRLPLAYLEQLVREETEGQSFGSGISQIKINKIRMGGYDKDLHLFLNISGKLSGDFELFFTPSFNSEDHKIVLENLKLKYVDPKKTDKFLFSLVRNIAESKLKSLLEDQLNSLLQDFVKTTKTMLDGYEIPPGIMLNGELLNYDIRSFQIIEPKMYFNVHADVKTQVRIIDLQLKY